MPTASADVRPQRALTALTALGVVALFVLLITPRASPAVLALLALAAGLAGAWPKPWPTSWRDLPAGAGLLIALGAWSMASSLWAVDRGEAIAKSALLIAIVLAAWWTQSMLARAEPEALHRFARGALIACAAGLVYLCLEELTGHAIKRTLFTAIPVLRPPARHIVLNADEVVVSSYISNRNMGVATLALWPMLLIAWLVVDRPRRSAATAALLALALATISLSKHETSIIALAVAALALGACYTAPRLALGLLAAGWIAACLLVVPLASWALNGAELHKASWLPNSARHRIVLWGYTAEQIPQRPLLGIGTASTRIIDGRRGVHVESYRDTPYPWRSGPHAHNVYLQVWYELGAVGALLLCAAGLALIAASARLPRQTVPYAAATMTSAAVTGAFSWGLWQAWFLCAFAVGAVLLAMAARIAGGGEISRAPAPSA